jgi:hypothetical protein
MLEAVFSMWSLTRLYEESLWVRRQKKIKLDDGQLLLTVTNKRQTRSLVREGAQQRQDSKIQIELISGRKSQSGLDAKTYWLTDRQS